MVQRTKACLLIIVLGFLLGLFVLDSQNAEFDSSEQVVLSDSHTILGWTSSDPSKPGRVLPLRQNPEKLGQSLYGVVQYFDYKLGYTQTYFTDPYFGCSLALNSEPYFAAAATSNKNLPFSSNGFGVVNATLSGGILFTEDPSNLHWNLWYLSQHGTSIHQVLDFPPQNSSSLSLAPFSQSIYFFQNNLHCTSFGGPMSSGSLTINLQSSFYLFSSCSSHQIDSSSVSLSLDAYSQKIIYNAYYSQALLGIVYSPLFPNRFREVISNSLLYDPLSLTGTTSIHKSSAFKHYLSVSTCYRDNVDASFNYQQLHVFDLQSNIQTSFIPPAVFDSNSSTFSNATPLNHFQSIPPYSTPNSSILQQLNDF